MLNSEIKESHEKIQRIKNEISKIVVGEEKVMDAIIKGLLCNGHCLLEGAVGVGKTLLIKTIAHITGCKFHRIQFTVDLLPTDITGIQAYEEGKGFYTIKGPIFSNFIIADEINRGSPKTQAALLEAMQEKQVSIGKKTFPLPKPFFVMATLNPIESFGVYRLPEAQVDRFLFKILMPYPKVHEEQKILTQNITLKDFEDFNLRRVISPEGIVKLQKLTKQIYLDKDVEEYIVKIVDATRNPKKYKIELGRYIEWAASPRASISLFIGAKADALMSGKKFVTPQNVKNIAHDVMRHRIILNYEGEANGIKTDDIITEILSKVPVP